MSQRFQFKLNKALPIAGYWAVPFAVLLFDRLNSHRKCGALATWFLIGIVELAKYLRNK